MHRLFGSAEQVGPDFSHEPVDLFENGLEVGSFGQRLVPVEARSRSVHQVAFPQAFVDLRLPRSRVSETVCVRYVSTMKVSVVFVGHEADLQFACFALPNIAYRVRLLVEVLPPHIGLNLVLEVLAVAVVRPVLVVIVHCINQPLLLPCSSPSFDSIFFAAFKMMLNKSFSPSSLSPRSIFFFFFFGVRELKLLYDFINSSS